MTDPLGYTEYYCALNGHTLVRPGAHTIWRNGMLLGFRQEDVWTIPKQLAFDLGEKQQDRYTEFDIIQIIPFSV